MSPKCYTPPPQREFENPPEGTYEAVCVDVVDLGWKEKRGEWADGTSQPKIQFVFEIDVKN